MIPKIKVELRLTGLNISPDEITNLVGVSPTRIFRIGESIQETDLKWKENGWCFSLGEYRDSYDLGQEVSELLDRIALFSKEIPRICDENKLFSEISCAIYVADETPTINFNQKTIAQLAKLKTSVDVDIILTGKSL
jgi:hypothetical protein